MQGTFIAGAALPVVAIAMMLMIRGERVKVVAV
jgi:hypothetical protein